MRVSNLGLHNINFWNFLRDWPYTPAIHATFALQVSCVLVAQGVKYLHQRENQMRHFIFSLFSFSLAWALELVSYRTPVLLLARVPSLFQVATSLPLQCNLSILPGIYALAASPSRPVRNPLPIPLRCQSLLAQAGRILLACDTVPTERHEMWGGFVRTSLAASACMRSFPASR